MESIDNVEDIAQINENKSGKHKLVRNQSQNQKEKRVIKKREKKNRKPAYFCQTNGPYLFLKILKSATMWSFKSKIEHKLGKILKLLKRNGQDGTGKTPDESVEKSQIIGLIHELQNEYNKLYSQYDSLKAGTGKKLRSKKEKESSSYAQSSDSEYYSSDELENGNDEFDPDFEFKTPREFQTPRNQKNRRNGKKREDSMLVSVSEESEASGQIKQLEEQLTAIRMDLESVSKEKDDLQIQLEEKETETLQLNNLISELKIMLEEKDDFQVRFQEKEMEATQLQETNLQLNSQISELQNLFEEKTKEISDLNRKMEGNEKDLSLKIEQMTKQLNKESAMVKALKDEAKTLIDEIARRTNSERNLLREKEGFLVQAEELKLEVNSLHDQKNELEEIIRAREENKPEEEETETSNQIVALKEQVSSLQQELDSAQRERRKWKMNSAQNLTEIENEEQNENGKDNDELKLLKTPSLDFQTLRVAESPRTPARVLNQHTLERKIVEHADKFQMKVENQMRLLAQRIRVAEQIQTESKESYKKILESLEQENKELNGKNLFYEAEAKKIRGVLSESGNFVLSELDSMVKRIDEKHGEFLSRISMVSNEIQLAKSWISDKNDEIKYLKENLEMYGCDKDEIEQISGNRGLKRKLEELEEKLRERDEILSVMGEEKREVIRQLCYQIDYHRNRYDELKETVSKMNVTFKKQDD